MIWSRLARLDQPDADLVNLLAARYRIIEEVAAISQKLGFKLVDQWSVDDIFAILDRLAERGLNLIDDIHEAGGGRQALSIVIR